MRDSAHYEAARARVREIRDFYDHLGIYVFVNIGLFIIDAFSSGGTWFFWPLLGWGIGLAVHAWSVFGPHLRIVAEWEDRKVEEMLDRDSAQGPRQPV